MICVDNSEWMRNGDFVPTRMQCQQDAANLILQCKLRANPENAVGLLSMANHVQVLSTMTQESGRLFMKLHQLEPQASCFTVSLSFSVFSAADRLILTALGVLQL
ncbi:hypothetical protein Y032_0086g1988 [Ancylostoma ceylanicum]|nr:hypothetical protein Y032_0086g1988 [Ancylostoma ceylanicum]